MAYFFLRRQKGVWGSSVLEGDTDRDLELQK